MIKFFRKTRQKLIKEGKLKSYFLYALGEIILVVMGILIAINLNNSNQDKLSFLYSYYEHIPQLNYNSMENTRSFNQEMFSSGILRAKYLQIDDERLNQEGFIYLQNMLNNTKQKILFENYLFQEKKLSQIVIRRCLQILDFMEGIPL